MFGEKNQQLRDVAPVGIQRLCRHASLGAEITHPARDFRGDGRVGGELGHRGKSGTAFFTLP